MSRGRLRRTAPPLVAAVLLAGACGGGGGDDEASSTTRVTTTTTTTAAGGESTSSTAATTVTTTARAGSAATTSTTAAGATTTTTRVAAPATPGLAFTAPGTYRYTTAGNFTSALGASQPRNGETVFTVDPPSGSEQRSVRLGLGRTTEQLLRYDNAGAYLISLRQSDQGVTKEIRPTQPALAVPIDAAPGRQWGWEATSTDNLTTVESTFRAVRTEDLTVAGQRVPTLVVEATVTLGGDVISTARQTMWISPEHRLIIKVEDFTQGRVGLITFSSRSTETLNSLQPG